MGLPSRIERLALKNVGECREFINEKLGLREDYADYMARCFWESCSPVFNSMWEELSSRYLPDVEYDLYSRLDEKGLGTLGKLCGRTSKELSDIADIEPQNAELIEMALVKVGLSLAK